MWILFDLGVGSRSYASIFFQKKRENFSKKPKTLIFLRDFRELYYLD